MREAAAEKAKVAILAAVGACEEAPVENELQQTSSVRSVDGRTRTTGTNGRMSIGRDEPHMHFALKNWSVFYS